MKKRNENSPEFKVFLMVMEAFGWLFYFASPNVFVCVINLFWVLSDKNGVQWYHILFQLFGVVMGVLLAEYVRRKHGCIKLMSFQYHLPELEEEGEGLANKESDAAPH